MIYRHQRPSVRVFRALERITREKWISGDEVGRIGQRLAFLACQHQYFWQAYNAAVSSECRIVGMIHGRPPAYVFDDNYRDVLNAVRKLEKNKALLPEIELLKTVRAI